MPPGRNLPRIVIAGASSLLGAEVRRSLEEGRLAAADFRLVDEELAAGTLTEAGGEPAVVQAVEEDSLAGSQCIFFTGAAAFTRRNAGAAERSGANVIDLSGAFLEEENGSIWFPELEKLRGTSLRPKANLYTVPSAPGTIAAMLSLGLRSVGLQRLAVVFLRPVSEAGRAGIGELESQTSRLLSFQPAGHPVFGVQVAFNLLDRYGQESGQNLARERKRIQREAATGIGDAGILPSVQLLHAPVFYGYTFAAFADLRPGTGEEEVAAACRDAGFVLAEKDNGTPSNLETAGASSISLAQPEADSLHRGSWWFWGAADNVKLPAANAVKLAEGLL